LIRRCMNQHSAALASGLRRRSFWETAYHTSTDYGQGQTHRGRNNRRWWHEILSSPKPRDCCLVSQFPVAWISR
jgi:hypothetical protein